LNHFNKNSFSTKLESAISLTMKAFEKYFLISIFISLTIVIYWFVNDKSQYIPLLFVMYLSPFILLTKRNYTFDDSLLLLVCFFLFAQYFIHPKQFRVSTIIYSVLFILLFTAYNKLLNRNSIKIQSYIKLIKLILYSYFIILLVQQFCVILSWPVFNLGWVFEDNKWKLNSLSMEPSNTSLIITILMFSYIYCISLIRNRKYDILHDIMLDKSIWFIYFYICLTTVSTSAFFCIFILSLYIMNGKYIIPISFFFLLTILIFNNLIDLYAWERFKTLIPLLLNFDAIGIYDIDPSSSARISPLIIYVKEFSFFSIETWIGHGNDYGETYLTNQLLGYMPEQTQGIGGMINFIYDYGIFTFITFFTAITRITFSKFFSYEMLFWATLLFIIPFNVYIHWLFWCVCATHKFFSKSIIFYNNRNSFKQTSLKISYRLIS
jgi:hypothetical protein